jgi:acetolactate synthase-1/3 small subunit
VRRTVDGALAGISGRGGSPLRLAVLATSPAVRGRSSLSVVMQADRVERHTIAVLVDNEPGILARVVGLFSGRGYNIESLTVAEVDRANHLSRITIVTSGTPMIIEQIKAQLSRLVPVHRVHDLTDEGPHVERELALIKVAGKGESRIESLRLADVFRARVIDSTTESFVFEMTGAAEKLNAFIALMEPLGLVEVSRTGAVAIARGPGRF